MQTCVPCPALSTGHKGRQGPPRANGVPAGGQDVPSPHAPSPFGLDEDSQPLTMTSCCPRSGISQSDWLVKRLK